MVGRSVLVRDGIVPDARDTHLFHPGPVVRHDHGVTTVDATSLIAELPQHQRLVLHLRVVRGLSVERTARLLGVGPDEVLLRQHWALNALRRVLRNSEAMG